MLTRGQTRRQFLKNCGTVKVYRLSPKFPPECCPRRSYFCFCLFILVSIHRRSILDAADGFLIYNLVWFALDIRVNMDFKKLQLPEIDLFDARSRPLKWIRFPCDFFMTHGPLHHFLVYDSNRHFFLLNRYIRCQVAIYLQTYQTQENHRSVTVGLPVSLYILYIYKS